MESFVNDFVQMFVRVPADDLFYIVLIAGGCAVILLPPKNPES